MVEENNNLMFELVKKLSDKGLTPEYNYLEELMKESEVVYEEVIKASELAGYVYVGDLYYKEFDKLRANENVVLFCINNNINLSSNFIKLCDLDKVDKFINLEAKNRLDVARAFIYLHYNSSFNRDNIMKLQDINKPDIFRQDISKLEFMHLLDDLVNSGHLYYKADKVGIYCKKNKLGVSEYVYNYMLARERKLWVERLFYIV